MEVTEREVRDPTHLAVHPLPVSSTVLAAAPGVGSSENMKVRAARSPGVPVYMDSLRPVRARYSMYQFVSTLTVPPPGLTITA